MTTSYLNKEEYPLVFEPTKKNLTVEETFELLKVNAEEIRKSLLKYGALLFRGFPIEGTEQFHAFIRELNYGPFVNYIGGGSPRTKVKGHVYTSTDAPAGIKIPLHNELSYFPNYPRHIYFHSEIPAAEGGATIIADARKVLKDVDPELRKKLNTKKIRYTARYYYKNWLMDLINKIQKGHKTWIDVLETDDKEEAERRCKDQGIDYEWLAKDWIAISQTRPGTIVHPETGEEVWFNQIQNFDTNPRFVGLWRYIAMKLFYCRKDTLIQEVNYADGDQIPREEVYHIMDVLDKNTISFPWQKGDVMVMDNILAMHGRDPFKGKRRTLTAMTN